MLCSSSCQWVLFDDGGRYTPPSRRMRWLIRISRQSASRPFRCRSWRSIAWIPSRTLHHHRFCQFYRTGMEDWNLVCEDQSWKYLGRAMFQWIQEYRMVVSQRTGYRVWVGYSECWRALHLIHCLWGYCMNRKGNQIYQCCFLVLDSTPRLRI